MEISQKKRSSALERRAKEFWQPYGKTKIEHDPAGRGRKTAEVEKQWYFFVGYFPTQKLSTILLWLVSQPPSPARLE